MNDDRFVNNINDVNILPFGEEEFMSADKYISKPFDYLENVVVGNIVKVKNVSDLFEIKIVGYHVTENISFDFAATKVNTKDDSLYFINKNNIEKIVSIEDNLLKK